MKEKPKVKIGNMKSLATPRKYGCDRTTLTDQISSEINTTKEENKVLKD